MPWPHWPAASRSGRVIAESIWGEGTPQFGGDVLVVDGRVLTGNFYDQHLLMSNDIRVPVGLLLPTSAPEPTMTESLRQTQALVSALGLRAGIYNVEFRTNHQGIVTIIDFGARIGGNLSALSSLLADGIDLVRASIDIALGRTVALSRVGPTWPHVGRLVVHSTRSGVLSEIRLHPALEAMAQHIVLAATPGDTVRPYRSSADRLGVIVLASRDIEAVLAVFAHPEDFFGVRLEGDDGSDVSRPV